MNSAAAREGFVKLAHDWDEMAERLVQAIEEAYRAPPKT
jgi:hypothetical protein